MSLEWVCKIVDVFLSNGILDLNYNVFLQFVIFRLRLFKFFNLFKLPIYLKVSNIVTGGS